MSQFGKYLFACFSIWKSKGDGLSFNSFKEDSIEDIRESIETSIEDHEEITLPGLGVFFEILWNNSDKDDKEFILRTIEKGL